MKCPQCRQVALPYSQFVFSISHGVGFERALKGYLRCSRCKELLKLEGLGTRFWVCLAAGIVLFILEIGFAYRISRSIGPTASLLLLIATLFTAILSSSYFGWKDATTRKVQTRRTA